MNAESAASIANLESDLRSFPIRLAVQGEDGFPHIISLWFQYRDGSFYSVTHESAWVLRQLEVNNQVGFEIATNKPPYKGIRGIGYISVFPLEDNLLEELIDNYLGNQDSDLARWLLSRKKDEMVIRIKPNNISHWDYSERMQGAAANG